QSYGRYMPPLQTFEDTAPANDGSTLVGLQYMPRILNLMLSVPGGGQRALMREMSKVLNPKLGVGILECISGMGVGRHLECIYLAGLETIVEDNPSYSYGIIQFKAFNPFYIDDSPTVAEFTSVTTVAFNWFDYGNTN